MARNSLSNLNDHLFEQLERLNDDELMKESLETEIKRAKSISNVAQTIINNANIVLEAQKYKEEYRLEDNEVPKMLSIKEQDEK